MGYYGKHSLESSWLETVLLWVFIIFVILLLAFIIGINIYALVQYGGKPANEIPSWVWWLWSRGNK